MMTTAIMAPTTYMPSMSTPYRMANGTTTTTSCASAHACGYRNSSVVPFEGAAEKLKLGAAMAGMAAVAVAAAVA